jgi:hypothetical protein
MESSPAGYQSMYFCNRQDEFRCFFSQENDPVFCNDICSVMEALGHQHNTPEWRLFIDSSKVSLKAVLLYNGNKYPSVPLAHAVNMRESHMKICNFSWKRFTMEYVSEISVGI